MPGVQRHFRLLPPDWSRRAFLGGTAALMLPGALALQPDRARLIETLKGSLAKVAGMGLCYFWDEDGKNLATNEQDVAVLQSVFKGFSEKIAPFYEFLMMKLFTPQPRSVNGVNFYVPFGGDTGIPLDKLLRDRFGSLHHLTLIGKTGAELEDYALPVPGLIFPKHADTLQLNFVYSGEEDVVGTTTPRFQRAGDGSATMSISTGFLRKVLLGCIYALPIVQNSSTLLWQSLRLSPGPSDTVLVNATDGQWSISLLPLLCVPDPSVYAFTEDALLFRSAHARFWRVYDALRGLERGAPLPSTAELNKLSNDVKTLDALSQLYFLVLMFIVSHETAHSVFMHEFASDPLKSAAQEQAADIAATVHLFFVALTNTFNNSQTWTATWRYSNLGTETLENKLIWFERLFGFGIANNIALRLLVEGDDPYHPTVQTRWSTNVRIWNNCVLACSRTERPLAV
jgi:hypothetical protein